MRLLLQPTGRAPATEVDVQPGTRAREVRAALARLTGDPRWASPGARLAAGPVAVDDEHVCGRHPLLPGAELRLSRGSVPPDEAALHVRFHLAVLGGPAWGPLAGIAPELVVGRGPGAPGSERLRVADTALSRDHLRLAARRRHVLVRDLGSSNGTVVVRADRRGTARELRTPGPPAGARRPGGRVRALGARTARLRSGDRLYAGASVLEIRGPRRRTAAPPDAGPPGAGAGAWLWLGPAVGSAALAASTRNPLLLVGALLGPALMLAHAGRARAGRLRSALRRTTDAPPGAGPASRVPDPELAGGAGHGAAEDQDGSPLAPADLAAASILATVPGVPWEPPPLPPGGLRRLTHAGRVDGSLVLAVTGRREPALAVARALAAGLVGPCGSATLVVRCDDDRRADWRWARWLAEPGGQGEGTTTARRVVVVDGPDALARTAGHDPAHAAALVLVVDGPGAVPAWCASVLDVDDDGVTLRTGATSRPLPLHGVSAAWSEAHARRVAAARGGGSTGSPPTGTKHDGDPLPRTSALGDLPGVPPPEAGAIAALWAEPAARGLRVPVGVGASGAVEVDLVADGPHALVAGTTGAGKSGLLQTLVLALALAHPPDRLAVALVDYKGGASFGPVARLPHVVGQVTDLDGALATRALAGLRAELHRRERLLADAGVPDVEELAAAHRAGRTSQAAPPRLLVVVDEFRALADEVPTFVPGLLRVAAQGRALGIHLVLATQRPAGAVGPDLRANIALRVALRVADTVESTDVLGVGDAAALPVDRPGRAVLRRGNRAPEQLQVALPHGPGGAGGAVRAATPWLTAPATWVPAGPEAPRGDDGLHRYVEAVCAAARGGAAPVSPWLPELPVSVTVDRLHDALLDGNATRSTADDGDVPLALGDVPDEQRRSLVTWRPQDGHLLVRGGPGSGRTTALHTVAHGALELGWDVHTVGLAGDALPAPVEVLGTVVGTDDPRRLARLVRLLARRPAGDAPSEADAPQLLLVDGLEAAVAALEGVARGAASELFVELLRDGRSRRVAVVASTGAGAGLASLTGHFASRLVLGPADGVADVLAGVPAELVGGRRGPGRAVHVGPEGAVLCQVAVVDGPPDVPARGWRRPSHRLAPVPTRVVLPLDPPDLSSRPDEAPDPRSRPGDDAPDPASRAGGRPTRHSPPTAPGVPVGRGGDAAEVLLLDVDGGALVVGPSGSGRTTALAVVAAALVRAGRTVAVVAEDAPLADLPGARWSVRRSGLGALLGALDERAGPGIPQSAGGPVDVVVDDLDALELAAPHLVERLADSLGRTHELHGTRSDGGPRSRLVASSTTARAAMAYREPLASLRAHRSGVVLQPHEPGSGDVFGTGVEWALDPALPHLPGRGVLVRGRDVVPLQVALPTRDAPA